jgi:hypothetical protein
LRGAVEWGGARTVEYGNRRTISSRVPMPSLWPDWIQAYCNFYLNLSSPSVWNLNSILVEGRGSVEQNRNKCPQRRIFRTISLQVETIFGRGMSVGSVITYKQVHKRYCTVPCRVLNISQLNMNAASFYRLLLVACANTVCAI